ncbi:Transposon Tf2-11 polyprotein [Rhizoctonia solani]|uniref:Transposon Tf2-11 polyprotein n=1 Tax=Rhizoctonia solani TaxID=456999 RepID=A0A0K6FZC8_9AGAM|nr:Transposon Tf2-11 polyprotein [Rhizoctonia solani]
MSVRRSPTPSGSGKRTPKSGVQAEPTEIPRLATPSGDIELSNVWELLRTMQEHLVLMQKQNEALVNSYEILAKDVKDIGDEQVEQREALTLLKDRTRDILDAVETTPKMPPQGPSFGSEATPRAAPGPSHIHSPTPIRPGSSVRFSGLGSPLAPKHRDPSPPIVTPTTREATTSGPPRTTSPPTTGTRASARPPKMKEPEHFDGTRGRVAKQWWTKISVWAAFQRDNYESEQVMLLHILTLMKPGKAADWAQPIIEKIISRDPAAPSTMSTLTDLFSATFGDPDTSRAAMRQLRSLAQTADANAYTTEFNNLAADLDWNDDAALRAQYEHGLSFRVKSQLIQRDPYPTTLAALQEAAIKIDGLYRELDQSNPRRKAQGPTEEKAKVQGQGERKRESMSLEERKKLPNYVSEEERKARKEAGLCIKCGSPDHMFRECKNGWRKERVPGKGKVKETAKTAQFADEQEADDHPIPKEYLEFAKVFGEEEFNKLPPHRPYDIDIELKEDAKLGHAPLYSMTPVESKELKEWLDKELAQGKITPSKSPVASPVMFVKKKDGSLRLVVDYRKLNEATKKNSYPLPRQDDLLAKIQGAKIFTKLDLRWGYNNVRVKEGDEWKTAFRTKYGLFETKVMPFGLTNAPAAFQHFMNDILRDLLDVTVIVYLDDILIFSKNPGEHTAHVKEVLKRLQENQLFCKASKCFFNTTTVEYLGIMISPKGISIEKGKVEAIQSWPTPKTRKQVQSFLGFANFLRRFIPDFSKMSRPLNDLIPKDKTWQWGDKEEKGFMDIKRALCEAPVLRHPDPEKPYFLETDASGVAMGAVLSQRQEDGRLHPVAYMSKSFQGAAHNYDTHDKELLAIIEALQHWRIFLEGTADPITIFTDHRNLEYWKESRNFNRRHARWHLLLAGFNFRIHYQPGKQSGKPDALSRRSDHGDVPPEPQVMLPTEVFANLGEIPEESSLEDVIRDQIDKDESLSEILAFLERNGPAPPSIAKQFRDYSLQDGFLMYQGKILIPDYEPLKNNLLRLHHDAPHAGHPGEQRTLELLRNLPKEPPPEERSNPKKTPRSTKPSLGAHLL